MMNRVFNWLSIEFNDSKRNVFLATVIFLSIFEAGAVSDVKGNKRIEIQFVGTEDFGRWESSTQQVYEVANFTVIENGKVIKDGQAKVKTRGQTSLRKFPRKNFNLNILEDESLKLAGVKENEFIFSASPEDSFLSRNMMGYRLFSLLGIPHVMPELIEVVLNGKSQGLYFSSQKPVDFAKKELKADIVIRRRHGQKFEIEKVNEEILSPDEQAEQLEVLKRIHDPRASIQERETLFRSHFILKDYFKWLGANWLIQNSDYEDEVFLVGKKNKMGKIEYRVVPWDLDDAFALLPQRGQSRSMGNIFAAESGLDQLILKSKALHREYLDVLNEMGQKLTPEALKALKADLLNAYQPYLQDPDVLNAGERDKVRSPHSNESLLKSLNSQLALVIRNGNKIGGPSGMCFQFYSP